MACVKGSDGRWYPDETQWEYVYDSLCDALSDFSEDDRSHPIYLAILKLTDELDDLIFKCL